MKLIIAGSRCFNNMYILDKYIHKSYSVFEIEEVVSGTARGADQVGERWAKLNKIKVKQFPANWDKYGKSAGYKRNIQMAEYGDQLVVFWDGNSVGTAMMITIARKRLMPITMIRI